MTWPLAPHRQDRIDRVMATLAADGPPDPAAARALDAISALRNRLAVSALSVPHREYGALDNQSPLLGSLPKEGQLVEMPLARCAELSSIDPAMGYDLYRLVCAVQPRRMLEIGTCIGISALFLLSAARDVGTLSRFVTLEGGEGLAAVARDILAGQGFGRGVAAVVAGRHGETLPAALSDLRPVDFAFVDGSHIGEEVLQQHTLLSEAAADEATLVFDDITWSSGMRAAWSEIRRRHGALCAVDCGRYGVLLLDRAWDGPPLRLARDC